MHPHVVACVSSNPNQEITDSDMFRLLAKYIGVFGTPQNLASSSSQNRQVVAMTAPVLSSSSSSTPTPTAIAMTAPVLNLNLNDANMDANTNADARQMSFVLPAIFTSIQSAPTPTDPRVLLKEVLSHTIAVKSFSGSVDMATAAPIAEEFKSYLTNNHGFTCKEWRLARYNPPFTLPFLRTNEIWVTIDEQEKET